MSRTTVPNTMKIPAEWVEPLNKCGIIPDFTLLASMSDWMEDRQLYVEAEILRWILHNQVWPQRSKISPDIIWGVTSLPIDLAMYLSHPPGTKDMETVVAAFNRLFRAWELASPEIRQRALQWLKP